MQPVPAALDGLPPHEIVDHGAPSRVGQGRKRHTPQAPTVDSRFVRLLCMECPQRADGALAQRQPAYLQKDETFPPFLDDPPLLLHRHLLPAPPPHPPP